MGSYIDVNNGTNHLDSHLTFTEAGDSGAKFILTACHTVHKVFPMIQFHSIVGTAAELAVEWGDHSATR